MENSHFEDSLESPQVNKEDIFTNNIIDTE